MVIAGTKKKTVAIITIYFFGFYYYPKNFIVNYGTSKNYFDIK